MEEFTKAQLEELLNQNITELIIPDGVERINISNREIQDMSEKIAKITKLSYPESIRNGLYYGVDKFKGLKEVELRGKGTKIPHRLFCAFTTVEKAIIPSTIRIIESSAFSGCTSLKEINLPPTLESIDSSAFFNCDSLTNVYLPKITGTVFSTGGLSLPPEETNNGTEYTIPANITKISALAFKNNKTIKKITIPATVQDISNSAFENCIGLENVVFEADIKLPHSLFKNCSALKSIKLPNNIDSIPDSIFEGCTSLENVECPNTVTSIFYNAFRDCSSLKSFKISENTTSIRENAFSGCSSLEEIDIPSSVSEIKPGAFNYCLSLKKITIPNTVNCFCHAGTLKYSFETMFTGCDSLKEVHLLFKQDEIDSSIFTKKRSLQYYEISNLEEKGMTKEEINKLNNTVFSCPSLEVVTLPLVKTIKGALNTLPSLKKVIIPDELNSLAPSDFVNLDMNIEFEVSEKAKIAINNIEKDGKIIAKEIYSKKGSRLLAVLTKETSFTVSDNIKQVEADCFPPNIVDLKLHNKISKIKSTESTICSKNVMKYLEEFTPDNSAELEKAKKEKISSIKATGAGGLVLAELEDYKYGIETKPVTKPRIGTQVKVKLPFGYAIEFFSPSKPKPAEKEPLAEFMNAIKTPIDESKGIEGEVDFILMLNKAIEKFKNEVDEVTPFYGDITEEIFKMIISKIFTDKSLVFDIELSQRKNNSSKYVFASDKVFVKISNRYVAVKTGFSAAKLLREPDNFVSLINKLCEQIKENDFENIKLFDIFDLQNWIKSN